MQQLENHVQNNVRGDHWVLCGVRVGVCVCSHVRLLQTSSNGWRARH